MITELLCALHHLCRFNGVTATPAETVKFFEEHFCANLGKCLNTRGEIRNRKIDQSKSLN